MSNSWRGTDDPLEALGDAVALNSRDFAADPFEAWIYGIICGWDDEDDDPDSGDAMGDLAVRWGWDENTVARLRRLRTNFRRLEEVGRTLTEGAK